MKIRKQMPRPRVSIRLIGDMSTLQSALAEFYALIRRRLELEGDFEVLQLCQRFVRVPFDGNDFFRVHSEPSAGRAGDVLIVLEPSDRLLDLMATLRAGDRDGDCIQADAHEPFLSGG